MPKKIYQRLAVLLLLGLLAACSQPTTVTPAPDTKLMTKAELGSSLKGLSKDVSKVLSGSALNLQMLALPAGSPADGIIDLVTGTVNGALSPAQMMQSLSAGLVQPKTSNLATQVEGIPLPRGEYVFSDETGWQVVGESDDLVFSYPFTNEFGETLPMQVTLDWDANGATQDVNSVNGLVEVPTAALLTVIQNETTLGTLSLEASWLNSSCEYAVLEPVGLSIKAAFADARDSLSFELNLTNLEGSGIIASDGFVEANNSGDRAKLDWKFTLNGTLSRTEACFIRDYKLNSGSFDFGLETSQAGSESSNSFGISFGIDSILIGEFGELVSLDITDGIVSVDDVAAARFAGTLDDSNGNGTPGENVLVSTEDGTTNVEALLTDLFAGETIPVEPKPTFR